MKSLPATVARTHFRQLIDMAQAEPVRITRRGRDVAVVMSPDEFRRMAEAARGKVDPSVARLHAETAARWAGVYAALAK